MSTKVMPAATDDNDTFTEEKTSLSVIDKAAEEAWGIQKLPEPNAQRKPLSVPKCAVPPMPPMPSVPPTTNPDNKEKTQDETKKEETDDDETDQSASMQNERMEQRMDAVLPRVCNITAFVALLSILVIFLPAAEQTWTQKFKEQDFLTSAQRSSNSNEALHVLTVDLQSCALHVIVDSDISETSSVRFEASLLSVPFLSKFLLSHDETTHTITSHLEVGSYFAPFFPCVVNLHVRPDADGSLDNVDLLVKTRGTQPCDIIFHNSSSSPGTNPRKKPLFHRLTVEGQVVHFVSALSQRAPASLLDVNIHSGSMNVSSLNGASSVNVTTVSADVEMMADDTILDIVRLVQPHQHYVIAGACIGTSCYSNQGELQSSQRNNNITLIFDNMTGSISGITVYPSFNMSSSSSPPTTQLHLTSDIGTLYVGAIISPLLLSRQFLIAAGITVPSFDAASIMALSQVNHFINTAPDEDALVILDVHGPNIPRRKWMYATRAPYIQIEPAWMFIMSLGVLSARQQHLQVRIVCGHWPFVDSWRQHNALSSATGGDTAAAATTASTSTNITSLSLPLVLNDDPEYGGKEENYADGHTYLLFSHLRDTMQVPLLADVLAFKTKDVALTFKNNGPLSFSTVPIDWRRNRFLYPAMLLSFIAALMGSLAVNKLLYQEGVSYMQDYVQQKQLRNKIKKLKTELKIDVDVDSDDEDGGDEEDDEENDQNVDGSNDIEEWQEEEREELYKKELTNRVMDDTKGKKNNIFDDDIPKQVLALVEFGDDVLKKLFPAEGVSGGVGNNNGLRQRKNVKNSQRKTPQQRYIETQRKKRESLTSRSHSISSGMSMNGELADKCTTNRCMKFRGCCKKDDSPSPFVLPTMWYRVQMSTTRNSLHDFIKSPNTYEKDEEKKWTAAGGGLGRTTIRRFTRLYSDWCDHNERRKVSVVENEAILKLLGVSLSSQLEQCVTHCRLKTKAEIRVFNQTQIKNGKPRKKKRFLNSYWNEAKKIADHFQQKKISQEVARFQIGEIAYYHFKDERLVCTGDEHDFITFDDLLKKFETFFEIMTGNNQGLDVRSIIEKTKTGSIVKKNMWGVAKVTMPNAGGGGGGGGGGGAAAAAFTSVVDSEMEDIKNMQDDPDLIPLYFARDSQDFGPTTLSRCNVEMLTGVEVLTIRQLKESLAKGRLGNRGKLLKALDCVKWYGQAFFEGWCFVIASSFICFTVPLPLCTMVLYHQRLFRDTTAMTNEFTSELLVTYPMNVDAWRTFDMPIHNQVVLLLALPYYAVSIIKLCCFYLNIKGPIRMFVRNVWIGFTGLWSLATVGWMIVILLWITLGAVLNPVAVLAHSVAVSSSFAYVFKMWSSGMLKMKRLRLRLREMIEQKLMDTMNKTNGVLVKKLQQSKLFQHAAATAATAATTTATTVANLRGDGVKEKIFPPRRLPRITPAWAFKLTDEDGNGVLDLQEFKKLLENMNINLSESRVLKIFASSDRAKTNTISYNEFLVCWNKLTWLIVDDALINTGLSRRNILLGLAGAIVSLATLFGFLFLSVSAFGGTGSFGSTVRSTMAFLASKLGTINEKKEPDNMAVKDAADKSLSVFLGSSVSPSSSSKEVEQNKSNEKED